MSDHHHDDGLFDPDDPLTMMGVATVGMTLEETAGQEEREQRASPEP